MSDPVTIALIGAVGAFLTAVMTKLGKVSDKISQINVSIELLEKNTNSIKDELVRVTGIEAYARGKKDELNAQQLGNGKVEKGKAPFWKQAWPKGSE